MPTTPLGYITYPSSGDTDWYSQSQNGLEDWLRRVELLGIPTYDTFGDLPTAGSTETVNPGTGQTQRQFAAVVGDATIYRDDGSAWVAWANYYEDADAVSAINNDADHGSTAPHNYFSGDHADLTNVTSGQHHTRYADSEARGAIEDGNVQRITGVNGHEIAFDHSSNWIEFLTSGNRTGIVTERIYLNHQTTWFRGRATDLTSPNGAQGQVLKDGGGGTTWDYSSPDRRELMGTATDGDASTNLDLTISHGTGFDEVIFSVEIAGNASNTSYGVFIQMNGDTGQNYDYNRIASGGVTQVTGATRFGFQVWGANTERNRFAVDGGSSQNFIRQMTGSADNRYTVVSGDQTSAASDGPVTDIRVFANFNASATMYAIGINGPQ